VQLIFISAPMTAAPYLAPFKKSYEEVARRMTPAQIAEAQRLAHEWKPTCLPLPAFCGR
jgi:hypothetical protein